MPSQPRLNKNERLLHRFYEPLVLLTILSPSTGGNGGKRSCIMDFNDVRDWQCRFLDQLAWICDYDHGGATVSAIGAEDSPSGPVYWLAAPGNPSERTRTHLQRILEQLRAAHDATQIELDDLEARITAHCIDFSRKKAKNYRRKLAICVAKCRELSSGQRLHSDEALLADLNVLIEQDRADVDLCRLAYNFRHAESLDRVTQKHNIRSESSVWSEARHYIGRLGSWPKASNTLVQIAASHPSFVDEFTVKQLRIAPPSPSPKADPMTNLTSALRRMLPADSGDRATIEENLQSIRLFDVASEFRTAYTSKNFKPRVHAEVALLEHFYQNCMTHVNSLRYIGCSKPSCYCCDLYIRHHPGHFVTRPCHGNVWKNWRAPLLRSENDNKDIGNHTRDILNSMITKIRSDVMFLIKTKASSNRRIPDSTTGISTSHPDLARSRLGPQPMGSTGTMPRDQPTRAQVHFDNSMESSKVLLADLGASSSPLQEKGGLLGPKTKPFEQEGAVKGDSEDEDQETIVFQGRARCHKPSS